MYIVIRRLFFSSVNLPCNTHNFLHFPPRLFYENVFVLRLSVSRLNSNELKHWWLQIKAVSNLRRVAWQSGKTWSHSSRFCLLAIVSCGSSISSHTFRNFIHTVRACYNMIYHYQYDRNKSIACDTEYIRNVKFSSMESSSCRKNR